MALPALVAAGKIFLKQGAKSAVKGAVKSKVKDKIKDKAKSSIREKLVSTARSGYSAGRRKSSFGSMSPLGVTPKISAVTKTTKVSKTGNPLEGMLSELILLNKSFSNLDVAYKNKIAEDKKAAADYRKVLDKQKKAQREEQLESKKTSISEESDSEVSEGKGPLDFITNFLKNILLGGLATFLLKNQGPIFKQIDLAMKNWRHVARLVAAFRKPLLKLAKFSAKVLLNPLYLPGKILGKTLKLTGKAIKGTFSVLGKSLKLGISGIFNLGKKLIDAARSGAKLAAQGLRFGARAGKAAFGALKGGQGIKGATKAVQTAAQRSAKQAAQKAPPKAPPKAGSAAKNLGKAARGAKKAIRIPVIGPLLVALDSYLSGDPLDQTLFKAGGAAIGGLLGNFIPIPILGMLIGEYVGEYVGNLFYYGLKSEGGWKKAGEILFSDLKKAFDVGKTVMDWLGSGVKRYIKNWPSMEIPEIGAFGFSLNKELGSNKLSPFKPLVEGNYFGNKDGKLTRLPDPLFMVKSPIEFLKHVKNSFLGTSDKKPDYTPKKYPDGVITQDNTDSDSSMKPLPKDKSSTPVSSGGKFGESSLISALDSAGYTNKNERAMFLAQMAHESGNFRYDEEIWGPTSTQKGYEGRSDLGNNQPGDGYKYRGRGYIQLTGRANYRQYGKLLGVDLENNPDLAKDPNIAARIALEYWKKRVDRKAAQNGDVKKVTYNINGGYNGLSDRQNKYNSYVQKIESGKISSSSSPSVPSPQVTSITPTADDSKDKTKSLQQGSSSDSSGGSPSIGSAGSGPNISALSQQASYEGQQSMMPLPIPTGGGGQSSAGSGGSKRGSAPGASVYDMLNSYHRAKLIGSLYKIG